MTRSPVGIRPLEETLEDHAARSVLGVRWWVVTLPLGAGLHHASVDASALEAVIVRVEFASGPGYAEVRSNGEYATHETAVDVEAALRYVPAIGRPLGAVTADLFGRSRLAAMALDIAGWDAFARSADRPLDRVFSERRAPSLPTHAPIGFGTVSEAGDLARRRAEAGFRRVKVRIGSSDVAHDLRRVQAVREAAGPTVTVITDANAGWSIDQALTALPRLADLEVAWLEQPTASIDDLVIVTREARKIAGPGPSGLRIRADESVTDAASVRALRAADAVDGVHLKLEKVGTILRLIDTIAEARRSDLAVALGQMDQGRLGCAATTHIASGLNLDEVELWGWADVVSDVAFPLIERHGSVLLSDRPGLGVTVDLPAAPKGIL